MSLTAFPYSCCLLSFPHSLSRSLTHSFTHHSIKNAPLHASATTAQPTTPQNSTAQTHPCSPETLLPTHLTTTTTRYQTRQAAQQTQMYCQIPAPHASYSTHPVSTLASVLLLRSLRLL